ncbi:otu domain-containing protein at3g57810 [Phtheirospermum japonicum]|uniref:Otu domain-containing protein at3g57810 n=1 Tax=Phtheirospermum japonicum TaxID=374723 RepID=A0A830D6B5_9LAMI|nr:otu domain-containing protein at3g57810 [Phtheirospermum japonicum]
MGKKLLMKNRQRELADEFKSSSLWKKKFDVYVKRIQQPYAWGGEPELLMCVHIVLRRDDENSIDVLFHGYGHYDILESLSGSRRERKHIQCKKLNRMFEPWPCLVQVSAYNFVVSG